ncbi:MAG: hypothetical protein RLZZ618_1364 [Pseudomonadota bacterium]|jgi:hypothetical protein
MAGLGVSVLLFVVYPLWVLLFWRFIHLVPIVITWPMLVLLANTWLIDSLNQETMGSGGGAAVTVGLFYMYVLGFPLFIAAKVVALLLARGFLYLAKTRCVKIRRGEGLSHL